MKMHNYKITSKTHTNTHTHTRTKVRYNPTMLLLNDEMNAHKEKKKYAGTISIMLKKYMTN